MSDERREAIAPEDLYGLPLDDFTRARDALARRLRDDGDDERAREVKSLRKPSLPAWAINRLAREDGNELRRLFALRDELATASDAQELRRLTNERRAALSHLLQRAEAILVEGGHAATAATTDAIAKTLQAGGTDEERHRIERGTLDRPLEPTGFEGLAGFEAGGAIDTEAEPAPRAGAAARRKAERLAKEADAAEREALELSREADAAQRRAQELAERASDARRRAEEKRRYADEALDSLGRE